MSQTQPDVFDAIIAGVDAFSDKVETYSPFYHFEPWDCPQPDEETLLAAKADGVDLLGGDIGRLCGPYPRLFQTGIITSTKHLVVGQAGSQSGKSLPAIILIAASIGGVAPYSFRYDKGVDTGIRRPITNENIVRWGRRSKRTGEIIDHNPDVPRESGWDCGNIVGAGIFPKELITPPGRQIWVGTIGESLTTMWWPRLAFGKTPIMPPEFIDRSKGNNGTTKNPNVIHCINGKSIHLKTFDQGHEKFESEKAWIVVIDEEPSDRRVFVSAWEHCEKSMRMTYTALNGMTWSHELLFNGQFDLAYFHASQFDSPYKTRAAIRSARSGYKRYERKSRVWGLHSQPDDTPFFNRDKIDGWIQRHKTTPIAFASFEPVSQCYGIVSKPHITAIPGLMDVAVRRIAKTQSNGTDTWNIFEDPVPGERYWLAADPAEGNEDPKAAQDRSKALMFRPPSEEDVEDRPVIVASISSTLPTLAFARTCAYAMRHYNNALLASERGVGRENEAFGIELEDWPYWFYYETKNSLTQKMQRKKGFNTKGYGRGIIIKRVEEWQNSVPAEGDPGIAEIGVLQEMFEAIVGKTSGGQPKCDHPKRGSLDYVIALGIGCYVYYNARDQLRCNATETTAQSEKPNRHRLVAPRYNNYGLNMLGYRQ